MRFRLLKPGRTTWLLALGLGSLAWFGLGACSGKPFTIGGASGASGNSSGGTNAGSGGESDSEAGESGSPEGGSGDVPSGGKGGAKANAGGGGKPATGCDCGAAEYCRDGKYCTKCADFSRLEFGTPQKLSTVSQPSISERFARPAGTGSALFYVSGALDNSKLFYAASPLSSMGTPVTVSVLPESGVLFVGGFSDQNLFFDRRQTDGRKLRMALWSASAVLTKDALVREPINTADSDDYSIAISPNTGHVYWMSTRNGAPELLLEATSVTPLPPPAVLDLKIKAGSAQCARSGEDATPWVNIDGTVLLFRNPSLDDSCEPNDSGATDLFAAPLNSDGTPKAAATALASLNTVGGGSTETDPTLSSDACTIYFATDNGTADYDLYKASRN